MVDKQIWLNGVAKPARRALAAAGYNELAQLTQISEQELLQLHGMGPKAIRHLREALAKQGLSFTPDKINSLSTRD